MPNLSTFFSSRPRICKVFCRLFQPKAFDFFSKRLNRTLLKETVRAYTLARRELRLRAFSPSRFPLHARVTH